MSAEAKVNATILDERAARLAARKATESGTETGEPILVFKLGEERFALRMSLIRTILPYAKVTPVALTTPDILGVTAHKGEVHSVYELSRLLELATATGASADRGRIVILRAEKHSPGVRVDQIEAIDFLEPSANSAGKADSTSRTYVKPRHSDALILIENLEILSNASLDGD